MTPPDGSDFQHGEARVSTLTAPLVILLHGGRALLLIEGADAPLPRSGHLSGAERVLSWTAECWRVETGGSVRWWGVALLDGVPAADAELRDLSGVHRWQLAAAPRLDVAPEALAAFVRAAGLNCREVFGFLIGHLLADRPGDTAEARAHRAFAASFITAAAERDGFIEILGAPDTGGLFAQGWSMSLSGGTARLANLADDLAVREAEVALFDREDILPSGHGFCFIAKAWAEPGLAAIEAMFFEQDGRLLRLDIVRGAVVQLGDEAATAHVAQMLPRLRGPEGTIAAFKRVCRPRFHGTDTLSGTALPVAAAFDTVLQAPDGTLLAIGWLLDPLRRVERVLIKSTANLYAPLNAGWSPLPRPDLNGGFGQDPRFERLLDERETMHGFIAHARARADQIEGAEVYLELVLDDGSCLFRPIAVTRFESAERLPQVLSVLSPSEPELARIAEEHLAPFLASVPVGTRISRGVRPIPLGQSGAEREVAAIVPFRSFAELQPMFALVAGTPEADMLEFVLVTDRATASAALERLGDAFRFYGLGGSLIIASEHDTLVARLDAGVAASTSGRVLCWLPAALPKAAGWLPRLIGEAAGLPVPGLLSPALTYEDGSIYFGGERADPAEGSCALSGYGAVRLHRGAPKRSAAGAAEIALIDRSALGRAGGFAGHLFGDGFAHADLADRLQRAGLAAWCSGAVEFWMLDDQPASEPSPFARMMQKVDAALLARRGRPGSGDLAA